MTSDLGPTCSIMPSSIRAGHFQNVFGRLTEIPIESWMPTVADLPHRPGATIYKLDLKRITADERARMVEHYQREFGLEAESIEADLDATGCPILSQDIIVAIPMRLLV